MEATVLEVISNVVQLSSKYLSHPNGVSFEIVPDSLFKFVLENQKIIDGNKKANCIIGISRFSVDATKVLL